jgi:hypothetical protein
MPFTEDLQLGAKWRNSKKGHLDSVARSHAHRALIQDMHHFPVSHGLATPAFIDLYPTNIQKCLAQALGLGPPPMRGEAAGDIGNVKINRLRRMPPPAAPPAGLAVTQPDGKRYDEMTLGVTDQERRVVRNLRGTRRRAWRGIDDARDNFATFPGACA